MKLYFSQKKLVNSSEMPQGSQFHCDDFTGSKLSLEPVCDFDLGR